LDLKFVMRTRGWQSDELQIHDTGHRLPLAVTMGEPAGIGGEILLKAWTKLRGGETTFLAIDQPDRLRAIATRFDIDCPVSPIDAPSQAADKFMQGLPVLPLPGPLAPVALGKPQAETGRAVIAAIDQAVALAQAGQLRAIVTNPIHKATLQAAGFGFPGHTEYLGHLTGATPVMMLAVQGLRVVPVTVHLALRAVAAALRQEDIVACGRITAAALRQDFGLAAPRLAVAALNPHAGESGNMGDEEERIIAPAVAALRREGIAVLGPAPADTLFHPAARASYDAVLCMYHDQALIPLKTIDFAGGVNVTLGLPLVRTSPDHGTALDIAPRGIADPSSLIAALRMADAMAEHRALLARR
jgi:4-hydroxythreonine-4-phosphate dehydrogenase